MTLQQYEDNLLTLPTYQRQPAAGAAHKLRQALVTGEAFAAARDRIAGQRQYFAPLSRVGQLVNFAGLTGP